EERTAGAVAEAGGEDFLFGRTALALEVATGETTGRGVFFAVIDGKGEEVLAGAHRLGDTGGDEDVGLADADIDGAVGEVGVGAGGEGQTEFGDRDVMFLIHYFRICGLSVADKSERLVTLEPNVPFATRKRAAAQAKPDASGI